MNAPKPSMWRTIIAMIITDLALLLALWVCAGKGDLAEKLLVTTSWSLVISLGAVAGHNSIQHLADTGGLKGAVSALMEPAAPETKPEAENNG